MKKPKIIIIEDQVIVNDMLFKTLEAKFEIVASTTDANLMLELCDKYLPDLVLTDICTAYNHSGITNGELIKNKYKDKIKVLVMTGVSEITFLNKARNANLDGFVYKNIKTSELFNVINKVLNGEKIFSEESANPEYNLLKKLTKQELKILTLLCNGIDREDIADELDITLGTLKNHISAILNKLEFDSVTKLLVFCTSNGYIVPKLK